MNVSLPLSLALAGLDAASIGRTVATRPDDRGAEVRAMLTWARSIGAAAVQLNAATPGVRPRDLDRSARRDLAATLRREGLACSGLDLWIPPEHFTDAARADRAVASVRGAIDLAADLAALAGGSVVSARPARPGVVSLLLPAEAPADLLAAITERAEARGVLLADHHWPPRDSSSPVLLLGIDPVAILAAREDPAAAAARLAPRAASARVADLSPGIGPTPGSRVELGRGRLDVFAYIVSLAAAGYTGSAVIDVRGLRDPAHAAAAAMSSLKSLTAGAAP